MTRQFTVIGAGLTDSCPAVRAVAASGICGVLNAFWELLPAPVIAGFLKQVTGAKADPGSFPPPVANVAWGGSMSNGRKERCRACVFRTRGRCASCTD